MVIVISGPGGVGKGTVVQELVRRDPRLWLSRSWTTRARRPGEAEDAYVFATDEEFDEKVASGGFLEWAEFLGHRYGTPKPRVDPDHDLVLEIDVQGAEQVLREHPDAVLVFMEAPSPDEQAARLRKRGDSEDRVARRVAAAEEESRRSRELGFHVVVNDDLEATIDALERLIDHHRNQVG